MTYATIDVLRSMVSNLPHTRADFSRRCRLVIDIDAAEEYNR